LGDLKAVLKFLKNSIFKVLSGITLILSGIFFYTSAFLGNGLFETINCITLPFEKISAEIANHAISFLRERKKSYELELKIEDLENEIRSLRNMVIDYYETKKENAQYAKYYDLKRENNSLKFVSASAIGKDPGDFFQNFNIDQGSSSGISVNDAVITENGMIGYVSHVNANSSRVKTILSPDVKIGAVDKMSLDSGVISGNIELADQNLTRMTLISSQNNIKSGDFVVSSGLSGMYPKNLLLGKIISLEYDNYDISNYAIVEPFEKIKDVQDVFVIIGFQGKGKIFGNTVKEFLSDDQADVE
jgi:rod shape-determining protein MreC